MLRVEDPFPLNGKMLERGAELVGDDEKAVLAKAKFLKRCVRVADPTPIADATPAAKE